MVLIGGFRVPRDAIVQGQVVGNFPAILGISIVFVADRGDETAGRLLIGVGDAENIVEDRVARTVGAPSGETIVAIVIGKIGIIRILRI